MTIVDGVVPSGIVMVSVTAWPVVLTFTDRLGAVIVRPSRPTSDTVPVAWVAYLPGRPENVATPTLALVSSSPMALVLIVPSALRYGPEPKKTSTFEAP